MYYVLYLRINHFFSCCKEKVYESLCRNYKEEEKENYELSSMKSLPKNIGSIEEGYALFCEAYLAFYYFRSFISEG